ncbi:hypothetical protein [Fervidobacterium thailandense]|uniref:Alpha/beta hydrolase n=1 Tax=Fervidobacterium thailandense TaxID=1008305 RepID=A0A1E3G530_9BACT|nr:hypothetical protein [Fervidobacterium thailandense]ODN31339.1 hypothetical protein A4H02_00825 [Fervidobacterium thailandense]
MPSSKNPLGGMAERLKSLGNVFKNARGLKKPRELLVTLWRRKVLFFTVVATITALIAGISLLSRGKNPQTELTEGVGMVENLVISIPPNAFPFAKSFTVRIAPRAVSESLKSLGNFVGNIFELVPSDGRYDMAAVPINVKYYFPSTLIGSNDANSVALASVSPDGKTFSVIPGSAINRDSRGYYVEANFFVIPKWLGVVVTPAKVLQTGLRPVREVISAEPSLLIVPGSDPNFGGAFESGKVTTVSIWQAAFPNRSIYVYRYPLTETRSFNYTQSLNEFKANTPLPSEIIFEAERLAQFLKQRSNVEFDILAHEIGGLITYYCLATHPEIKNVRRVAYLSVPFYGTNVADPRLSLSLYPTKPESGELLYKIPASVFSNLKAYLKSYIESINSYYDDICPESQVLTKLRFLPYRTDVETVAYMGNTPPLSIDVTGSMLEKFYPELVLNTGDGVVTRSSARLPYMTLKIFNGSWNTFYSTDEFVEEIKRFFRYDVPPVPAFTDDTFAERVKDEREKILERFLGTGEKFTFYTQQWELSDNPKLKFLQSLNYPGRQIAVFGNVIYTADEKGLYIGGTKMFEETVFNLKETIDGVSYGTVNKVMYRKLTEVLTYNQMPADDYIATKDFAIFARPRPNDWIEFVDENGNLITRLRGVYGRVIYDGEEILLLTNREVYRYYYGMKYTAPLGLRQSYDMTYAVVVGDYILATTRAYGLLIFDKAGNYAYVGEGWIGNLGLYKSKNYVLAVGDSFVTVIDIQNRRIDRIVEDVPGIVYDATVSEDLLYIQTSEGLLIYRIL